MIEGTKLLTSCVVNTLPQTMRQAKVLCFPVKKKTYFCVGNCPTLNIVEQKNIGLSSIDERKNKWQINGTTKKKRKEAFNLGMFQLYLWTFFKSETFNFPFIYLYFSVLLSLCFLQQLLFWMFVNTKKKSDSVCWFKHF